MKPEVENDSIASSMAHHADAVLSTRAPAPPLFLRKLINTGDNPAVQAVQEAQPITHVAGVPFAEWAQRVLNSQSGQSLSRPESLPVHASASTLGATGSSEREPTQTVANTGRGRPSVQPTPKEVQDAQLRAAYYLHELDHRQRIETDNSFTLRAMYTKSSPDIDPSLGAFKPRKPSKLMTPEEHGYAHHAAALRHALVDLQHKTKTEMPSLPPDAVISRSRKRTVPEEHHGQTEGSRTKSLKLLSGASSTSRAFPAAGTSENASRSSHGLEIISSHHQGASSSRVVSSSTERRATARTSVKPHSVPAGLTRDYGSSSLVEKNDQLQQVLHRIFGPTPISSPRRSPSPSPPRDESGARALGA